LAKRAVKKKSVKGKASAKSKAKSRSKKSAPSRWRWFYRLFVLAVVLGVLGLVAIDAVVYKKFTGKKWSLPSHVYSRPLELYQGLSLSREQLQWELESMGYQRVSSAKSPGQ